MHFSTALIVFLLIFVLIFLLKMPIPMGMMTACVFYFIVTGDNPKMVAQQTVDNHDGIHAEISVEGYAKQLLIVRVLSGELLYNKKIVVQ